MDARQLNEWTCSPGETKKLNYSYSYLACSLILLGFCLAGLYFFSRERKRTLISAFVSVPAACTTILFVPEYWKPIRITQLSVGIEDIIFSFATGGIVWIIVSFSVGRNYSYNISLSTVIRRYLILVALRTLVYILFSPMKWGAMTEALVGIFLVGLILFVRFHFKSWRITVAGSLLFTLYYSIITGFFLTLFPNMRLYWNNNNLWGISVLIVPLGEIVWALAYGAVWPLAMAYVFDLNISRSEMKTVTSVSQTNKTQQQSF